APGHEAHEIGFAVPGAQAEDGVRVPVIDRALDTILQGVRQRRRDLERYGETRPAEVRGARAGAALDTGPPELAIARDDLVDGAEDDVTLGDREVADDVVAHLRDDTRQRHERLAARAARHGLLGRRIFDAVVATGLHEKLPDAGEALGFARRRIG